MFVITHKCQGFVYSTVPPPPSSIHDVVGSIVQNSVYTLWLRYDQCVRTWMFATVSTDVIIEIHNLPHAFLIWDRINTRFNESCQNRSSDLKNRVANPVRLEGQSMEDYLRNIEVIADSLASI